MSAWTDERRVDELLEIADAILYILRPITVGMLYGFAYWMIGSQGWKAVVIGLVISACMVLGLARRTIMRAGLIFVPFAMLYWIGFIPSPATLMAMACR